ncbi:MAG: hypothetical protein ABFC67_14000 [Mizugakiibacter sp.]|uniref:hypothetical protein n=1 Tax=Mizugakiibacter sp. TaxID=1972610 RepID=UPI0031C23892|nr:hypothetical protein [Xanthomonadaceae bacterium]
MKRLKLSARSWPIFYSTGFAVLILVSLAAGIMLTFLLSGLLVIPAAKMLNLAGTAYGLIGVVVLSEAVVRSDRIKRFMVIWVGAALLWAHTGLALGACIGAVIVFFSGRPSAYAAYGFALSLFSYVVLIGGVVDATVTYPRSVRLQELTPRHQRLGLIVLVTGLALQLAAAIIEF